MTNTDTDTAADVAKHSPHVAPRKASSKKGATRKKDAPKGRKTAQNGKAKAGKKTTQPARSRPESKGAKILVLLQRPKGATLGELAKLTGWQNHSIRGFLSGTLGKKLGLTVESAKREDGERVYSVKK